MEEKPTYLSDDIGKFILRLTVGGLLLPHGIQKIIKGVEGMFPMLEANGLPTFLAYGVYAGEVLAPLLLIVGFLTRPAAVIVMINMGVAVWLAHTQDLAKITTDWSHYFAIEKAAFYFFGALALMFLGGGRISPMRGRGMLN